MLLHDIAKGRGGDHSELGAEIALELGPRLGLTAEETETVSWLVLHHLLLSGDRLQARHRRPQDHPRHRRHGAVARAPAAVAGADGGRHARRSGPRSGTAGRRRCCANSTARRRKCWPAACPSPSATCACNARARPAAAPAGRLAEAGDRAFIALGYPGYWLSFDPETHARHAALVRDAERASAPLTVRHPAAAGARGDRGHGLLPPTMPGCSAASPARWRWPAPTSSMPDPHPDQRHGAGHILDPGRRGRHVRRAAPAGAARRC